jgi:hypothetical protein
VGIMCLPTRWSVKPFGMDFMDLSHVPVSHQADPHTSADTTNDLALMVVRCLGAGHPGAISPGRWRVPVSQCRHRQIHQVAGRDSCGQDQ